jgi:putative membrane protein
MMSGGMMGSWGMGYGIFGSFVMILIWFLIVAAIVLVIRWLFHPAGLRSPMLHETPLESLKKRYAEGDINREEFETRKRHML